MERIHKNLTTDMIIVGIENTFMRPKLWMENDKLVRKYIEEGWGIYDDTADVDRAIEISDAYYGDHSSVVQLYQQTGKPIMMQNVDIVT